MSLCAERKIDCHHHVIDPARFPYAADAIYRPSAQEIGTAAQFHAVMAAYGVQHALTVGPNSGYGNDNGCLLDAIATGAGRFKGIAVVPNDASIDMLATLQRQGIVGVAFNATYHGVDHYAGIEPLLGRLAELGLFAQVQVEGDQLVALAPQLERSQVRILVDHCGRPLPEAGLAQPGFSTLLALAQAGRTWVKLSGYAKFSHQGWPYADAHPYARALIDAFTLERCMWGSDWPFLRASERLDYGPLLALVEQLLPVARDRAQLLWHTPHALFRFPD